MTPSGRASARHDLAGVGPDPVELQLQPIDAVDGDVDESGCCTDATAPRVVSPDVRHRNLPAVLVAVLFVAIIGGAVFAAGGGERAPSPAMPPPPPTLPAASATPDTVRTESAADRRTEIWGVCAPAHYPPAADLGPLLSPNGKPGVEVRDVLLRVVYGAEPSGICHLSRPGG